MMIAPELAQEIVERAMKVLPFNVNVMDGRGVIIASGTPERIGDLHPGAQTVLARGDVVEIESAATPSLPGAKPGINLPLYGRGEICGVVGITGNPDEIRQFGELVRITAEMIIEHALLTAELQREQRYREEFVFQLLKRTGVSAEGMSAWAARLGIDLTVSRAVTLLQIESEDAGADLQLHCLQLAQTALSSRYEGLLTAVMSPNELAILEAFDASGRPSDCRRRAVLRLHELEGVVAASIAVDYRIGSGIGLPGLEGAVASYQSAKTTLAVTRRRASGKRLGSFYEYSLPVLLSDLDVGWKQEQFLRPFRNLSASDPKSAILIKTLAAWFANNGHPTQTAKALHIHRNTLDYRLQRIRESTGLELGSIDDMLLLYVGMQLSKHEVGPNT